MDKRILLLLIWKILFMRPAMQGNRGRIHSAVLAWAIAALALCCPSDTQAGGSGLNVLLVANDASSNSLALANYYRIKRQIPPAQVLTVNWPGDNIEWTEQEFTNTLLNPILEFVETRQLADQVQYAVLSMDFPYRIAGSQENSTTAALFYGVKHAGNNTASSYALSEGSFPAEAPVTAPTNSFLAFMLTGDTLEAAKQAVDQGVDGDQTYPSKHAWLVKSDQPDRNRRFTAFDNAVFNSRLCEDYCLYRTNSSSVPPWTDLLGCQLGLANFSLAADAFIPGALGDSMTSFGGQLFEASGQTTLLEFLQAGASGSYGTVTEPGTSTTRFPNPMVYFYQARGFSLAECYYQSLEQPYAGLLVGEPLTAPWRQSFSGTWEGLSTNAVLQGTTNLSLAFSGGSLARPIDRIDLFLDGKYLQTETNITPQAGNHLTVRLNGHSVTYAVPTNASLKSIAEGFASELNLAVNTDITKVTAAAFGDRIELQSFADPLPEGIFEFNDDEGTTNTSYLAAAGPFSRASSVSTPGFNEEGSLRVEFFTDPGVSNVLEASTNFTEWVPVASNALGGPLEYLETDVFLYPQRFYRVAVPSPKPMPYLEIVGLSPSNEFVVQVTGPTDRPYIIQTSPDFRVWTDVLTNSLGGDSQFLDPFNPSSPQHYYRTRSADTNDYEATWIAATNSIGNTVRVTDTSPGDIVVWSSTNDTHWIPIYTYSGQRGVRTETSSTSGAGEPLTTHVTSARDEFLESTAQGLRGFGVEVDPFVFPPVSISDSSFLTLTVTKVSGVETGLTVTNTPGNKDLMTFLQAFAAAVNSDPGLTTPDGLDADDLIEGFPGQILFNLRARTGGPMAAELEAHLTGSSELYITPAVAAPLDQNISDLRPRNHLYISAGVNSLTHRFDLDTTTLPDGYHELTAVAYEGTHVKAQTPVSIPIIVSNSMLQATLVLAEADSVLSVTNTVDLVALAEDRLDIETIELLSTGGLYAMKTNQNTVSFHVNGLDLGVGQHPFHALVTTTNGLRYRTDTLTVTLTP